jgi:CO/xanthine dehydrogenase Mo-binding subunit
MNIDTTRRHFMAGAGALALGFTLDVDASAQQPSLLPGDLRQNPKVSSWLRIEANGRVRLLIGKVELGQGILTAVAQLCADELEIDIKRIDITSGDTRLVPDEGTTAGSFSMPNCGTAVRQVSAEARQILLGLAATRLNAEVSKLAIQDGTVSGPDGKRVTYWELVSGRELEIDATGKAPLKPREARRYAGKHVPRIDIPAKVTGERIFLHDLRLEGMLHARVLRQPAYDAELVALDVSEVEKMPGVVKIVRNGSFVGVLAEREEQAINAHARLQQIAKWQQPDKSETQDTIYDWLQSQPERLLKIREQPNTSAPAEALSVEATYRRPYQMHGSIGPSVAIAVLDAQGITRVDTHSQSVFETGQAIAEMLGVDKSKVHMRHEQGSGCYGHNGADDVAADAALLAQAVPGRPVRVQWSRQDEHKWEPYGAAMVVKTKARVDANGDILDWRLDLWSTSHLARPAGKAGNLLPARALEKPFAMPAAVNNGPPNYAADRNAIAGYDFVGHTVHTHFIPAFAARSSSTRALGAYANVFAIESFMDELAHRAKVDPLEYRLRYLKDERARAVLQKTAEMIGWKGRGKGPNRGFGLAMARYKGTASWNGVAMEVEVDRSSGNIRVLRVVSANDAGEVVAPDGVKNQIEGGIVQSLSWTLKEAVRFGAGGVKSVDWVSYPILSFSEVPPIEVELIDRPGAPFLGAGEASQGPAGAALANAVFDATGVRIRDIPFTPARIKAALG